MQLIGKWTFGSVISCFACIFFSPSDSCGATLAAGDAASYFRVIWGLLIVLGIILILYGILRKRFSLLATGTNQEIKIIEIKPLMGKKSLCLINVKGQEHLLGVSGDRITHIAALTPQPQSSFAEVLQATGVTPQP
jgi:flagellar protein FliO/FliZ